MYRKDRQFERKGTVGGVLGTQLENLRSLHQGQGRDPSSCESLQVPQHSLCIGANSVQRSNPILPWVSHIWPCIIYNPEAQRVLEMLLLELFGAECQQS
jgi:hypothetical protein